MCTNQAEYSFIGGGRLNQIHNLCNVIVGGQANCILTGSRFSGILGGCNNKVRTGCDCVFIIGSGLHGVASNTTFVNNLTSAGSIRAGNGFSGNVAGCTTITVTDGIITAAS
tara:strand:- start:487 stop:822 length:336 start_codon:yes stop_codon:yes gene_type:complete